QTVIEESKIDTGIYRDVRFPLQIRITLLLLNNTLMINPAEILIISRPRFAIRSQRISTAGQDTFITRCTVTDSQSHATQDIKVFHEFLFRDNPCCRGTGKPSPLVIIGKYGRAVVTERNSQNVTVLKRIVQTAEERKLVTPSLPRAQIGPLKIGCRTNVV